MGKVTWKNPPTAAELLERAKAKAVHRINDAYSAEAAPLVKEYPAVEQQGWPIQSAEADAYLAWHADQQGPAPATPVLDNILVGRNGTNGTETLYELCLAVRENTQLFTQFQQLTGKRQRLVKAVKAAETAEAAEAVTW